MDRQTDTLREFRVYKRSAIYVLVYGIIHACVALWADYPVARAASEVAPLMLVTGLGAIWYWKLRRVPLKSGTGIGEQQARSGDSS
jgi:hypothetical protein